MMIGWIKNVENLKVCGWKAGIVKGKQRYRCKNCNKNQGEADGRMKYSDEERKHAVVLYWKGCGFRRIARIMSKIFNKNCRYQTIMNRSKRAGLKVLSEKTKQEKVEVLEMNQSID